MTDPAVDQDVSFAFVRATLAKIQKVQAEQSMIEAKRAGASKLLARLIAVFGSLMTAAAIGGFVWVWTAQTSNALQDVAIEQLVKRDSQHEDMQTANHEIERRIDEVERATKSINTRLNRIEKENSERHGEVLQELRRLRAAARPCGEGR